MRDDVVLVDSVDQADACLYITTPEVFDSRPDKPTFLFTMFEATKLHDIYREKIQKADFILVPSNWVRGIFTPHFPEDKIWVVPHGVEEDFRFVPRKKNPKKFRYLWVGAANPRKGFQELIYVWGKLGLASNPEIELYIKTTRVPNVTIQRKQNVTLDSRIATKEEMIEIYQKAHCFVWPTRGEGFGLPLAEAMATGLPSIATGFSGVTDFFDSKVGYPLKYRLGMMPMTSPILGDMGEVEAAFPDVQDLVDNMIFVRRNYKSALNKGMLASARIKSDFTWENSAEALVSSIKEGLSRGN
jgi:glycosyltransferase involved in cell wall biosynthesis